MRSAQMPKLTVVESLASLAVAPIIRKVVVKGDKKTMAIRFLVASIVISLILPPLLSLGWLPERGSNGLWYILTAYDFLSQLLWIVTASIIYSLYADVTDDVVRHTGKRLEGAIFAFQSLIDRVSAALGAMLAGSLLTAIHYPVVNDSSIPTKVLTRLGLSYMGAWLLFASIGALLLSAYGLARSDATEVRA
jgi:Na+/melibiose symporter-like transporter